jgi:WD40 repeat protein
LKFHPSGELLAAAGEDGHLYVLDTSTGELIASIDVDSTPILSMDFSPDGTALAMCSAGGRLHLWNLQNEGTTRVHAVDSTTADLTFLGGPDFLATAGESIRFWDTKNLVERFQLAELESPIRDIEFSVSTGNLYAATGGGEIKAFDLSSLQDQLDRMSLGFGQRLPSRADTLKPQTGSAWKPLLKRLGAQRNIRTSTN